MVQIGKLIQNERRIQNVTQEDLCEGICDVSTLSKIENGRQEPNLTTFVSLMQRLGLPSERYCSLVSHEDFETQDLMYETKRQFAAGRYEEVTKLLVQLEKCANPKDRVVKQYMMFIRTAILTGKDRSKNAFQNALEQLLQAIQLTRPKIDLDELSKWLYSIQEIEVLDAIANAYFNLGESQKALDIFQQLLKYLKRHCLTIEDIGRVMPLVTYNYSRVLGLTKRYQDALEICEIGLEYCREYGRTLLLGPLLCNKGCCLCEMGQKEEGREIFKQCYYVQKAYQRIMDAKSLADNVWKDYQIRLD